MSEATDFPWPLHYERQKERAERAEALLRRAAESLESLRRRHRECEDCWYACPKAEDFCRDDTDGQCDCGADRANRIIEDTLAEIRKVTGS